MKKLKQILIPVAVVAVGVLGAFATQMSDNSNNTFLATEVGWIDNPEPCQQEHMCDVEGTYVCTAIIGTTQKVVRGKFSSSDTSCLKPLFQNLPN